MKIGCSTSSAALLFLAGCALAACASSSPAPAHETDAPASSASNASSASTASTATATASASAPPPAAVRVLQTPALPEVSCTIRQEKWGGAIRLRADGPTFAKLAPATIELHLAKPGPVVLLTQAELRLTVFADEQKIYFKEPTLVAGFLMPSAFTQLTYEPVTKADKLPLSVDLSKDFSSPSRATEDVDCAKLQLKPSSYDVDAELKIDAKTPHATLAKGTDLSADAKGAAVARTLDERDCLVLESKGNRRRIAFDLTDYWAVGWVDKKALSAPGPNGIGFSGAGLGEYGTYAIGSGHPSCNRDLTVYGQVGGERSLIGTLVQGSFYQLDAPQPDSVPKGFISFHTVTPWLTLEKGALLLFKSDDFATCK
ncbi:MAG: hypothetical protein U0271_44750 [Polyangiaceae bacterium]